MLHVSLCQLYVILNFNIYVLYIFNIYIYVKQNATVSYRYLNCGIDTASDKNLLLVVFSVSFVCVFHSVISFKVRST